MKHILAALIIATALVPSLSRADDLDDALAVCALHKKRVARIFDPNDKTENPAYMPGFGHCADLATKAAERELGAEKARGDARLRDDAARTKAVLDKLNKK
jgi:hypothetical protein